MYKSSFLSSIIAILLLIFGFISGFSTKYKIPIQALHIGIASGFIILVPLIIYVHIKRFYVKGPYDLIAWFHFLFFAFILNVTVRMLKVWLPSFEKNKKNTKHKNHNHEHFKQY